MPDETGEARRKQRANRGGWAAFWITPGEVCRGDRWFVILNHSNALRLGVSMVNVRFQVEMKKARLFPAAPLSVSGRG